MNSNNLAGSVKCKSATSTDFSIYRDAHQTPNLAERLGIRTKDDYAFCQDVCGVHHEKTPSVKLYSDGFKCFSCGNHGSNIDLVILYENRDLWGACERIADVAGLPPPRRDPEAQKRYEARQSIYQTYEQIWSDSRRDHERGIEYLITRGIKRDLIEHDVGYLPRNYKPPDLEEAKRAGLYSKHGNLLFRDCAIIPIRSHGSIVNLYGRVLHPTENRSNHLYCAKTDPPQEMTLWGLNDRRNGSHYFLTEAIIDALTLESHEIPALAAFGTQRLTEESVQALKRSGVEKVTVCFDTDPNGAGQDGAAKSARRLSRAGFHTEITSFPLLGGCQ